MARTAVQSTKQQVNQESQTYCLYKDQSYLH